MTTTILQGDCLETLKTLDAGIIQTVVTSPPYFGLRDYGVDGQIGLEESPEAYVAKLVAVFREVRRVLADDGTLWLNLGDSYAGSGKGPTGHNGIGDQELRQGFSSRGSSIGSRHGDSGHTSGVKPPQGMKAKDLIGIPWMVAFALRADGWYLRQDIIWAKPNPMPESVTDRCTKSHEYIFLLSKSARYYYNAEAIMEPLAASSVSRLSQDMEHQAGSSRVPGKTNGNMKAVSKNLQPDGQQPNSMHLRRAEGLSDEQYQARNKRDVWSISEDEFIQFLKWKAEQATHKKDVWMVTTKPYSEAHFATFPPDLIEPCILAGSKEGDIVLDPFNGSGTTGATAVKYHRNYIGCELNPAYIELTNRRLGTVQPVLFT